MPDFDYDMFVIGAGSGGVRAARMSAQFGARVAIAEERYLGGTCVNVGCVPKKLFVYASHISEEMRDAKGLGWSLPPATFDWPTLIANKNTEIDRLNGVYDKLLKDRNVEVLHGRARLIDPHAVAINDRTLTARYILIAAGSRPHVPDIPGCELGITSDEAFFLKTLPKRVLIIGGGYIAVEFAGIFHGLGAHVTQTYRGPLFLRGFDDDVRQALAEAMAARGIDLRLDRNVTRLEKSNDAIIVTLTDGSTVETDCVLFATGREPYTRDLGLEAAGVEADPRGAIRVDAHSKTNIDSVYAVGDVTNRMNLTPVALAEGMAVAKTLFGNQPTAMHYHNIPTAVFSQPPIATVGLTEKHARQAYDDVNVYRSSFYPLKSALAGRREKTLMKIIVDAATDRVLGVHIMGPDAAEMIQGVAIALQCGATKSQFDATIGVHPTSAEELVTMRTRAD
ncbi:MAG: glutathione-disulfide reductase [Planctomycetes bacterium]|nr:glutathione-disulfide reductase [Planctomycetota bacterium]